MKYKEFVDWCNQRACDGCWSMKTATYCIGVCETINAEHFWKREKIWREQYGEYVGEIELVEASNSKNFGKPMITITVTIRRRNC